MDKQIQLPQKLEFPSKQPSRRALIKQKALANKKTSNKPIEELPAFFQEEYSEHQSQQPRPKPTFVSKPSRSTCQEKQELAQKEVQEKLSQLAQERKNNTRKLVAELIQRECQEHSETDEESSSEDEVEAYKHWRIREVKRVLKEREAKEAREKELKEIERRRNLTDWERKQEDQALGTDETAKLQQRPINYLQKFYHKGVFYQERDPEGKLHPVFQRDFNAPVEGDYDKSVLPSVLQKRRGEFGRKGQSKWTHLTAEDTTDFDPYFKPNEELFLKQQMKGAGYKGMNSFGR